MTATAEEMAGAITELLAHPRRRRQIQEAARAKVELEYGWDPVARKAAGLYREISGVQ